MSDTCIVCLGDLGEGASEDNTVARVVPRPGDNANDATVLDRAKQPEQDVAEEIAHLIPCGHNLHNDCLKPWVERANSCPICRQNFNVVELVAKIGGKNSV